MNFILQCETGYGVIGNGTDEANVIPAIKLRGKVFSFAYGIQTTFGTTAFAYLVVLNM